MKISVYEAFEQTYKRPPVSVAFTPYRICPIGAHVDHQKGKITGFAIDKGIHIAYGPKENGIIEIQSLQFPKRAQWHISSTPDTKQDDWADHLRGATIALGKRYNLRKGLTQELAKKIVADIKDSKLKVQASIQGEQVRVTGKSKDDLQDVIKMLRSNEDKYDYPLQFTNYR